MKITRKILRRGQRHLRHIEQIARRSPQLRGRRNEGRLVRILNEYLEQARHRPPWLLKAELTSRTQDHQGVDVVATTDTGPIFLQVKSSELHQSLFEAERLRRWRSGGRMLNIRTVVVSDDRSDGSILRTALREIRHLRSAMQRHGTFLPPKRGA